MSSSAAEKMRRKASARKGAELGSTTGVGFAIGIDLTTGAPKDRAREGATRLGEASGAGVGAGVEIWVGVEEKSEEDAEGGGMPGRESPRHKESI